MSIRPYKTILETAETEYLIQKSRFIGYAAPVHTEEEALAFLKGIRSRHPQATHHCYAYIIGANAGIMRYSDDGEPAGTAGFPMMGVLQAQDVTDLCVVAVRYFGGVLLGAGGLVRAYSHTCALAVSAGTVIAKEPSRRILFDCPYPVWDKVRHFLFSQSDIVVEDTVFGASVEVTLLAKEKDTEQWLRILQDQLNGNLDALVSDPFLHHWPAENA